MENVRSILVYVGGDRVGDALMKLPFVKALREQWPDARLTWLCGYDKSAFGGVLSDVATGLIDEIIDDAKVPQQWSERFKPWPEPERLFDAGPYDLIIDTQRQARVTLNLKRLPHRRFVSGAVGFLFSDVKPPAGYCKPAMLSLQILNLGRLAMGKPVSADAPLPPPIIPPDEQVAAATQWLPDGERWVGIVPGAGGAEKRWPFDRLTGLANALSAQGLRPVFVMGPEEAEIADALKAAAPDALLPTAANPPYSDLPSFVMALGARLSVAVAADCGIGHMLAAANTPMVSLFGPTTPGKFAPLTPRLEIIRAQTWGRETMDAIPQDAVEAAVLRILEDTNQ